MVDNKKGQQMTLGTIIAIVLGIAVLVFLIFGFSTGWSNMWDKITELGGGAANVDDVVRGCEVACAQNSVDAFCRNERTMKFGQTRESWNGTDPRINVTKTVGSCEDFTNITRYPSSLGVKKCAAITCS